MDWANQTARWDENHLGFEIWCTLYYSFDSSTNALSNSTVLIIIQYKDLGVTQISYIFKGSKLLHNLVSFNILSRVAQTNFMDFPPD